MGTISVTNITDGTTMDAADVNNQVNTIVNEFNGNIDNANIKSSAAIATSKLADDAGITHAKVAAGFSVQMVSTLSSSVATGTTTIPLDDTIPQITEGTEFITCSITPKSATNKLVIEANLYVSLSTTSADIIAALFQDSTTDALSAIEAYVGANVSPAPLKIVHTMTAGTTSSTTFRIRVGGNTASTVTFNGASGSRRFGAIPKSSIVITEYKA